MDESFEGLLREAGLLLGAAVASAERMAGGYTPQQLHRLRLNDGRIAVMKSAFPAEALDQPDWPGVLRREVRAYRELQVLSPWRPAHLGDLELDGHVALLMEDLTGATRVPPWTDESIASVARDLAAMHRATLGTTPPASVPALPVPPFFDRIAAWREYVDGTPIDWGDPVWEQWLPPACVAGSTALASLMPDIPRCVVHYDVRSDNLFVRDGKLVLVDWPDPAWTTPTIDSLYWALGIAVERGDDPTVIHGEYLSNAPQVTRAEIRFGLAFLTGFLIAGLQRVKVPPTVTALRLRFLRVTLPWFARELDLPEPPAV